MKLLFILFYTFVIAFFNEYHGAFGCSDKLPSAMSTNGNCKKLRLSCAKLKNKCNIKLGLALKKSNWAKKCKKALKTNSNKRVDVFCPKTCKTCIDGNWESWSSYGECFKERTRRCNNPKPSGGGASCPGSNSEKITCKTVNGQWNSWSSWDSACSACPTGRASKARERVCNNPAPSQGGKWCEGFWIESKTCFSPQCVVYGHQSDCKCSGTLVGVSDTLQEAIDDCKRHSKCCITAFERVRKFYSFSKPSISSGQQANGHHCWTNGIW